MRYRAAKTPKGKAVESRRRTPQAREKEVKLQGDQGKADGRSVLVGRTNAVGTEVTVEHVPQVAAVLNEEGVVETVLHTVLFESFGGRGLAVPS